MKPLYFYLQKSVDVVMFATLYFAVTRFLAPQIFQDKDFFLFWPGDALFLAIALGHFRRFGYTIFIGQALGCFAFNYADKGLLDQTLKFVFLDLGETLSIYFILKYYKVNHLNQIKALKCFALTSAVVSTVGALLFGLLILNISISDFNLFVAPFKGWWMSRMSAWFAVTPALWALSEYRLFLHRFKKSSFI